MPIRAVCACGKVYVFKDKVAGCKAKCPACGGVVEIPSQPVAKPAPRPAAAGASGRRPPAVHPPVQPVRRPAITVRPAPKRRSWVGPVVGLIFVVVVAAGLGLVYHFGLSGRQPEVRPVAPPAATGTLAAVSPSPAPATDTTPKADPSPKAVPIIPVVLPKVAPEPAPVVPANPVPALKPDAPAGAVVSIVKGEDPAETVPQALALIGGLKPIIKDGQMVVIKPNLVTPEKAERPGLMTDVRITEALVKEIQKTAKCRIIIAEGCATKTDEKTQAELTTMNGFEQNGYTAMARKYGVELKDLNTDQRRTVRIPGLQGRPEYQMPETIMQCNVLIDVPVLKTHTIATVTLGIKNLFGLMAMPKSQYHFGTLEQTLVDIVCMRPPDLVLVDGLTGTEGDGPLRGTPIKMDLVLAGRNVLAVDSVAAAVMGFDPKSINHFSIAAARGVGTNDLAKIEVRGNPIDEVKKAFVRPQLEPQ